MTNQDRKKRKTTGLRNEGQFEDIDTFDIDTIIVDGYNRNEIMKAIEALLTIAGVQMYGKTHKWKRL